VFYFFHTKQDATNANYYRGLLFEGLLRQYLSATGYDVELDRIKQNSLEYDIKGVHNVDRRPILGEAKAHQDTITGKEVSAFVGKFYPFYLTDNTYAALFLSTSALAPDADDYLRNLQAKSPFKITLIFGADLEQRVRRALNLPGVDVVSLNAAHLIPHLSAQHLLHTDLGTFVVVVGSADAGHLDDRFLLVSANGVIVTAADLHVGLKGAIQAFQELEPVLGRPVHIDNSTVSREIPSGLITSQDWLDYRRPASRAHFVGREDAIRTARQILDSSERGTVVEIKSRSGVGKSSLLATLAETCTADGMRVELHDARDVRSSNDVFSLIGRFSRKLGTVRTFEDVPGVLDEIVRTSVNRSIFMIDQFESTFMSPEVFYAYEYLALCVTRTAGKVALFFARKDDLLTTHDDIQVNLDRLRDIATSISLEDFSRQEASKLIEKVAKASAARMSSRILEQVLEFAQGFPWLIKRTMAHVNAMISGGTKQQDLLAGDLHLKDLFEEELSELDEHERGYLTRIVAALPATYQALARRSENDPLLPKMLEKFTARRLLRLSAGTYDAYNDVFKDFLLYERVPDRSQSQVFRMGLGPVMRAFRAIGGHARVDVDALRQALGKSAGGAYNTLRELNVAGLVIKSNNGWIVPDVVREFEHQGRLGEFVRQSVLKNRAVSEFMLHLDKEGEFQRAKLVRFLQDQFPFVAAKPKVWEQYAGHFVDWLDRLRLVHASDDDEVLLPVEGDKDTIVRRLGNLNIVVRGARRRNATFVPSREWSVYVKLVRTIAVGSVSISTLPKSNVTVLGELARLGVIERRDGIVISRMGSEQFETHVRKLLSQAMYQKFWTAMKGSLLWEDAVGRLPGLGKLSLTTRRNLGKKLANWGRELGFLDKVRVLRAKKTKKSPARRTNKRAKTRASLHKAKDVALAQKTRTGSRASRPSAHKMAARGSRTIAVAPSLNENERAVLRCLAATAKAMSLTTLAEKSFPHLDPVQGSSWVRNSVRKPLALGLIAKPRQGVYKILAAGKEAIDAHDRSVHR